jgi:hypothetical protein
MAIYDFAGVTTEVTTDVLTPALNWESRRENYEYAKQSKEIYALMTDEQREATTKRVKLALEVMYDNIDKWLPSSFSFDDIGSCINIRYMMVVTDIESDVVEDELITSKRVKSAASDLQQIIKELEDLE